LPLEGLLVTAQGLCRTCWYWFRIRVTSSPTPAATTSLSLASTTTASAAFLLVRLTEVKAGHVDKSCVSSHIFRECASMLAQLMTLQVQLRRKDDELLLLTFVIGAEIVVLLEMLLESIVVHVVVRLPRILSIAQKTPLVLVAAVLVQFIVVVEARAAEGAKRMAPEACLIDRTWPVVSIPHVLLQLLIREKVVFVSEYLLASGAQVAHLLVVGASDVAMKVGPAQAGKVAVDIRAVVPKQ